MFGLRSARSRAIAAGALGLFVLAGVAATAAVDVTLWLVIGLSAAAFLVAAGAVAMVIVSVVRPLAALRASARAIAAGDVEARAKVRGPEEVASLARDFNAMTDALSAKAKEYIDTTNLTGVTILRVDKDNRVSFLNDVMCEFLGRSREEILGTPILDYLHPEDAASTIQAVLKMVQSKGLVTGIVSRHVTPMGTRVTEWNGYPIFDEEGRYAGVHGTGRDITERRRAEEALRESEDRHRAMFEQAADSLVLVDAETGELVQFNDKAHQNLGYTREEFERLKIPDFEIIESPEEVAKHIEKIVKEGADTFETKHRTKSGEFRDIEVRSKALSIQGRDLVQSIWRDITERKRAEEALRRREEEMRVVAENVPALFSYVDADGRYRFVNKRYEEWFGISPTEVIGKHYGEVLGEATYDVIKGRVETALSGQPVRYEEALPYRHGGTRWVTADYVPDVDEAGKVKGFFALITDITERKRAEEALRESEEKYRRLVQDSLDGIVVTQGLEMRLVNPALLEMFGCQREEEMVGRPFTEFISPEYRELLVQRGYAREKGQDEPERYEYKALRKDGSEFDAEISVTRITYQGKPARHGIVRDVTERKRAEDALRESEERFSRLAGATFEGLVIHERGKILDANPAFARMFGYELFEVIGMHALDFTAPQSRDLLWQGILSRREESFEALGLRKDGSTLVCELRGKDIPYQERMVTVVAIWDITERKRAEDALHKVREGIESRVERRVQEVNGYNLTFRELTVLHLVTAGESDKEIATVLGISPLTAHKHLANILDKMGAASRTEAGVRALQEGLLD